ncbi:MAG: hypothetical protein QOI74_2251 [Micromonosporaceae bacterium]|nr:hypothetical protein [Micromonosporaceae bacterium]
MVIPPDRRLPKAVDSRYGDGFVGGRTFRTGGHELLMTAGNVAKRASAVSLLPPVVALTITATGWFAINQSTPFGPAVLGWIPAPVTLGLAALASYRTAAAPEAPLAVRLFWRRLASVCAVVTLGLIVQAGYVVAGLNTDAARVPPPASVLYVGGVLYLVWALLRVPVEPRTPGEWVRLTLDCATVVLGAAVFMWYAGFGRIVARGDTRSVWTPLLAGSVLLVGVAATTKIVLAEAGPVDISALRLLGAGLLIGGVSAGAAPLIITRPNVRPVEVAVPLIAVILVLAAARQRQAFRTERPAARSRGAVRPVSLLPYTAVIATDVLLVLATTVHVDGRRYVVVAGAIVITALVAVRQMAAFADNVRLVARLRQQEDRLRHQATHDALTQLANRELFRERLEAALGRPGSGAHSDTAVLLIDLDDFKIVNDTLGHSVGDRLLAVVAERIERCVHPGDTVARLGGDEFAVLLRQAWPAAVDGVAEAILCSLRQPAVVDGYDLLMQASIGVTGARPGDSPEALLRNADIAMYAAKERGKGSFAWYLPGMAAGILEHAQLGAQLRQALDGGQFRLLYQPVVRLADSRIVGMEALVRWAHPSRGEVCPADFIATAERTGLIVALGRWVLREACRQKAAWHRAHGELSPATIGVNVSGRQLQEPGFADEVADAVHEFGLQPHNLVLEVTESAVLAGAQTMETLQALHNFGVKLALDDFGTGQSSLALIRTCPVQILKLDKSFVVGTDTDLDAGSVAARRNGSRTRQQAAVATAVVHIANALGLDAVAEGIESQQQAELMSDLGYRLGQGFHLVPPRPAVEIDELLAGTPVRR